VLLARSVDYLWPSEGQFAHGTLLLRAYAVPSSSPVGNFAVASSAIVIIGLIGVTGNPF
jgi:hypothetical protein